MLGGDEGRHLVGRRLEPVLAAVDHGGILLGEPGDVRLGVVDPVQERELGVGAVDELGHGLVDAILRADRPHIDLGAVDDEFGPLDGLPGPSDQLSAAFLVESALGVEDVALGLGQRRGAPAPRIFVRLHVQAQVGVQPRVVGQQHPYLVAPHGLRHDDLARLPQRRGDVVDGERMGAAVEDVVKPQLVREVASGRRVAEGRGLHHVVTDDRGQELGDLRRADVGVLDLLLDLLLLVGQVFVRGTGALHITPPLQQVEGPGDPAGEPGDVLVEAVVEQHGEVAGRCGEAVDVFDEEQGLEQADRDRGGLGAGGQLPLGLQDVADRGGLHGLTDAREHEVEGRHGADGLVRELLRHVLDDAQHGALADRGVAALEHVVPRQADQRRLEERELVGHEGIAAGEVLPALIVAVGLGPVREVEQGAEVRALGVVQRIELGLAVGVLAEQALLDDLLDIAAGQFHAGGEAGLDLGEVVGLPCGAVADDPVHVLLAGDAHPRPAAALRVEGFDDGLEVEHEFRVGADELAHLVGQEQQPTIRGALGQPLGDLVGEVLDGQGEPLLVAGEDVLGGRLPGHLRPGLRDIALLQDALLAALLPGHRGDLGEGLAEAPQQAAAVEVAFEAGHRRLARVVAAGLVEHLDEDLQQGVGLVLVDERRLLVDVEQQAGGGDARHPRQRGGEHGIALGLGGEGVDDRPTRMILARHIAQQVGEHLEQVRFSGAEETGDPHAVAAAVDRGGVGLQQIGQGGGGLAGEHVLVDLGRQMLGVVGLDDALDRTGDVLGEDAADRDVAHAGSCSRMFLAR